MTLKWTCDAEGNWRQVWVAVAVKNGRLVEVFGAGAVAEAAATMGRAA